MASALAPDQIALVVNRNVPDSAKLAQFYSQVRGIPADRTIELDLPAGEEMPFDRYERDVTPVVQQALRDRGLEQRVSCLVTFWGIPLRIADRANGPAENAELSYLHQQARRVSVKLQTMVQGIEKQAAEVDVSFKPASGGESFEMLAQRANHAGKAIDAAMRQITDPQLRQRITQFSIQTMADFAAPVQLDRPSSTRPDPASTRPATTRPLEELIQRPFDSMARAELRELTRRSAGIFGYSRTLQDQIDYLTPQATGSAFDNELALLWWGQYPRPRWLPNPLNPRFRNLRSPRTLMVMRLDAPTTQGVRDLIADSVEVERYGLKGKLVVDARGMAAADSKARPDPMGAFDQRLRNLARQVQAVSAVPAMLDDKPEVIPPNSVDDVALYCGWYSLRNYVPGMKFNRGAVGYHVASFELVSLHSANEGGWVHGLLGAGVVGTLGPVAEPYLHSFPPPDEFFPLLLTGKLTLAEVYWTTTPLTSWMQTCIGDPLYNPYAKHPAMKVEDLPQPLRTAIESIATGNTER